MKNKPFTSFLKIAACALLFATVAAQADDSKPDPSGSWFWTSPGRNGGPDRTNTLTLKVESSKVTGKLSAGRGSTEITDGSITNDMISFAIVRERNGNSMTNKYSGKIAGDKITGKMEYTRDGEPASRDWAAQRSPESK